MPVTAAKFTINQYRRMVQSGVLEDLRVELLNGEIIEMPSEGAPHADGSTEARDYLIVLLGNRAQVREGHPITLPETNSEPEPDLAIVALQRYRDRHPFPSEVFWLIEFSDSSLEKDLDDKRRVYARSGIPEYWVVNLRSRELVVHRDPNGEDYETVAILSRGTLHPVAFPEITLSVEQILGV